MSKYELEQLIKKLQESQMESKSMDSYNYIQGKLDLAEEFLREISKGTDHGTAWKAEDRP